MTKTNGAPTLIFGKPVPSFMVDPGRKVGQSESGPGCARHPHSYTFCNMYWYMWWLDGLHPGQTKPCANVGVKSFHAETWVWRISLARILARVCELFSAVSFFPSSDPEPAGSGIQGQESTNVGGLCPTANPLLRSSLLLGGSIEPQNKTCTSYTMH